MSDHSWDFVGHRDVLVGYCTGLTDICSSKMFLVQTYQKYDGRIPNQSNRGTQLPSVATAKKKQQPNSPDNK